MNLIALSGRKGTGKSTLAAVLEIQHGYKRCSFAEPLREMLRAGLGIDCTHMSTKQKEEPIEWLDGVTARRLMQTLGTEWGRDTIHQELWLRVMQRTLNEAVRMDRSIVIDDVRFNNEAELVKSYGGMLYLIQRVDILEGASDSHSSETGLDKIPWSRQVALAKEDDARRRTLLLQDTAAKMVAECQQMKSL